MQHIVIIGNGIAGVTAARHIRKRSSNPITLISAESDFFFSRTALMYVYMGHMRFKDLKPYEDHFWSKNNIDLKKRYVNRVDTDARTLHFEEGEQLNYDILILATGSVPAKYGWEGQDLEGVQGLVSKQDLELLEQNAPNNKVCPHAVIVGGGLIGVELAEMLHTRNIKVTMLVREHAFWSTILPDGEAQMISRHIQSHGIDLRHNEELDAILDDGTGRACGVRTKKGKEIPCNLVGITTGVQPQIGFLKGSKIETDRGILVNRSLETNIKNVYAIGDCAQQREAIDQRKPIEAVWYTGRMMGETVAQTICGNPFEYNPGNWFNSAKFMDIEYQTYGWVNSRRNKKAYEQHLHWKHEDDTKCLTLAYHQETGAFLGINAFGIRMRHQVIDQWLSENREITYVIDHLAAANFDPEFFKAYEPEIRRHFKKGSTLKFS